MKKKGKKKFMETLKDKWGVENYWQVGVILIVFSLAGSTIAFTKKYYFAFLGYTEHTHWLIKLITALLIYQVVLMFYGTLLGQFRFFWNKEKKMFAGLGKLFVKLVTLPASIGSRRDA